MPVKQPNLIRAIKSDLVDLIEIQ